MSQVESVDASTVVRANRVRGTLRKDESALFASIFESTRQAADRMAETQQARAEAARQAGQRHEYLSDSLSDARRDETPQGRRNQQPADEPERVDRMKDLQRRNRQAAPSPRQAPETAASKAEVDRQPAGRDPVGDRPAAEVASEPPAPANAEPVDADATADAPSVGPSAQQAGRDEAGQSTGTIARDPLTFSPPAHAAVPAPVGAWSSPSDGSATVDVTPVQRVPAFVDREATTTGREGGSGQTTAQAGAAGKAGEAGRSAGTSLEFQHMLESAGRLRARLMASPGRAAAIVNGEGSAKGVNLSEARGASELSEVIRSSLGSRRSVMTLRLQPPELGQLRIDVRMHDQNLTLRLEVETEVARDALQARLGDLRQSLERHGVQLNQVDVELRPPVTQTAAGGSGQHQAMDAGGDTPQHESGGAQRGAGEGFNGDLPGSPAGGSESMTDPGTEGSADGNGYDRLERLAETGVDLVV